MKQLTSLVGFCLVIALIVTGCGGGGHRPAGTNTLSGVVIDNLSDQPVEGVRVSIGRAWAMTDHTGAFTIRELAEGAQTMVVKANGYETKNVSVTVSTPGTTLTDNVKIVPLYTLSGTVTDVAGNLIPGATILLDEEEVTKSLINGTYQISVPDSGAHNITAQATINGKTWIGTRAVDVYSDGPTMNMNIIMGAYDILGDIRGTVTNTSNHTLAGVRVIAIARYPQPESGRPADEISVVSKVAVTNSSGFYTIPDLPASITVNGVKETLIYDVMASFAGESGDSGGYENLIKTATVGNNLVTTLDFKLSRSSTVAPPVPVGWTDPDGLFVVSYTVPKVITTRAAASAYDAVKSCISDRTRRAIAAKRKYTSRSAPAGSVIENDVIWYSIWNAEFGIDPPNNLAGFAVYRGSTVNIDPIDDYRIDFFRDPSMVSYADTSNALTAGSTYWYGVTAIGTSYLDQYDNFNPDAESEMSYPVSVTPLAKLTVTAPANTASVNSGVTFSWNAVAGARSYRVYVYNDYPILDALFTPQGDPARPDHLPTWGESAAVSGTSVVFNDTDFTLQSGHTYWWVALASNANDFDSGNAYAISELRSFNVR